ncbi:MAG TPA: 1-phosphofructokinase family hexose kinase [Tepidisphaeraceae bacterium]|nr:1-phosphofructokinase family hexose kinase [Tepidisphaeraceae bacterium]
MILCLGTTPAVQRTMIFKQLTLNQVNRAVEVLETPAGKSINVAKILTILGEPALAIGFLGGDRGEQLRRDLDAAGVPHDFITVQANTRMCITVIDQASDVHTELVEEAPPVEQDAWNALLAKLPALIQKSRMVTMSGTLVPGAPQDLYAQCAHLAAQAGIPAIIDAQGPALLAALPAKPLLVKPNRAELAKTLGQSLETESALRDAMRHVHELGAANILITMGGDGALGFDGRSFFHIDPPKIDVVNTIGSGDSVTAGIAQAMLHGQSFQEACRLGIACGAANALTIVSGLVHVPDVQRLLPQVRIRPA